MALSYKRRAFVEAYLQTWNATKAADQANYAHPGRQGHRLLKNVEIQQAIQERIAEIAMSADEVLARLSQQASVDISDFLNEHGGINWQAVKEQGYLIKSIIHEKGKQSRLVLHDSQRALELMGKHHRLFVEKHEVGGLIEHRISDGIRIFEYGSETNSGT